MPDTTAATRARVQRRDFKRACKRGEIDVTAALRHDLAQRMLVFEVLGALSYRSTRDPQERLTHHAERAPLRVCERAGVNPLIRVKLLSDLDRQALADAYRAYHRER